MENLKGKLNGVITRLGDTVMRFPRKLRSLDARIKELNEELEDLRRIRDEVEADLRSTEPNYIDATALVDECNKQPYFQVQTSEGLKPVFACVAEDGSRAIVIAVDPLIKHEIKPDAEVFEELIWLKGEKR